MPQCAANPCEFLRVFFMFGELIRNVVDLHP
jgi:hypothetical protein